VRETTKGCDGLQARFLWLRIGVPTLGASKHGVEFAPTLFVKVRSPPSRAPIVESRYLALCEGVRRIRWP